MVWQGSKMAVFLKRSKIKTLDCPLDRSQKIRASRHIKSEFLLKILLPYVVIIPPLGGIYNTRGVGMVDGEHDVLGWGQFIIRVGIGSVSWLRWQLKTLVTTTTKKKKSHDHEHQILLGDDLKFRMAFKPLLETRLMGQ